MARPSTALPIGFHPEMDEYMLTMAQSFFLHQQYHEWAHFEGFARRLPSGHRWMVAAGAASVAEALGQWRFDDEDCEHLLMQGFDRRFVEHLSQWRFAGNVDAVPEGSVLCAGVPLISVDGPRLDCTLVEAEVLRLVNGASVFATKAARIVMAADGRPVSDFSLRRQHGPGMEGVVARSAYIGGFASTSAWRAARRLGIPSNGTMAHHYVLRGTRAEEVSAFVQFLLDWPSRAVVLIDTYDTESGARAAVAASRLAGVPLRAVRLDSGDLDALSRKVRAVLDAAGMTATRIVATNDLDEHAIGRLVAADAPIDAFGVGTKLVRAGCGPDGEAGADELSLVFKLTDQVVGGERAPRMKLSAAKQTLPGRHACWRDDDGPLIADFEETVPGAERLTRPLVRGGAAVGTEPLAQVRDRCAAELTALADAGCLTAPMQPRLSAQVRELRDRILAHG